MTGDCQVCGMASAAVQTKLVRRLEGEPFATVERCIDAAGCRVRVEAAGGKWDIGEAETRHGPRGFTEGHRQVFAAAKRWREGRRDGTA